MNERFRWRHTTVADRSIAAWPRREFLDVTAPEYGIGRAVCRKVGGATAGIGYDRRFAISGPGARTNVQVEALCQCA
jgi:hypothetical protein